MFFKKKPSEVRMSPEVTQFALHKMIEEKRREHGIWEEGQQVNLHDEEVIILSFIAMVLDQVAELPLPGGMPNPMTCVHLQNGLCAACGGMTAGLLVHSPLGEFQVVIFKKVDHYGGEDGDMFSIGIMEPDDE